MKNLINRASIGAKKTNYLFKARWLQGAASANESKKMQVNPRKSLLKEGLSKDESSTRYRLVIDSLSTRYRVWQYSLGKIAAVVCMLLTIGSGNAWGAETTGTINFGNGSGHTAINSTSVTGNDSQGVTWTVTTVFPSSSSFTQSTNYSQVGSSSNAATSITFTASLASSQTITGFSVNLGGFSGTAGDVTLKVGETVVGTGNLAASADVTINCSSWIAGKDLTVTITSISKGVKCYSISYTYGTTMYSVGWNVNGGAASGSPTTSVPNGWRVTALPTTPTSSNCDGSKVFVGWSATEISGTTDTRPSDLFMDPLDAPTVTGAVTYYAVFATLVSSSTLLTENFADASAGDNTSTDNQSTSWSGNANIPTTSVAYQAGGAIKLASSSYCGYIVTKQLTAAVGAVLTISFDIKGWTAVEDVVEVMGNNDEFTQPRDIKYTALYNESFQNKSTNVVLTTANPYIKIRSCGRSFMDNLVIISRTYSSYATTCCATIVELADNTPANGEISFTRDAVATCSATDANRQTTMTITPSAGYKLSAFNYSTGTGTISPTNQSPGAPNTSLNSATPQEITLTFGQGVEGTCTANATFSEMVVTSWTWTLHVGGAAVTTDPVQVYVGQKVQCDVAYTPNDVLSTHKSNTSYSYPAPWSNSYLGSPGKAGDHFTVTGTNSTGEGTTSVTLTHNDGPTKTINYKVIALPKVTFVDRIHDLTDFSSGGEDLPASGILEATISADKYTVTTTLKTPTHADVDDPGASYNTCERQHLHLVGWIDKAWVDENPDATHSEIVAATAYFYAPNTDIDLVAKNGKEYIAVWAKEVTP